MARFFADLFFGTSEGHPLDRCWPPLGHPWSDCLPFFDEFRSLFAPNIKDSRATFRYFVNKWHQQHLITKQVRIQNSMLTMSPHKSCFLNRIGGTPEGITIILLPQTVRNRWNMLGRSWSQHSSRSDYNVTLNIRVCCLIDVGRSIAIFIII